MACGQNFRTRELYEKDVIELLLKIQKGKENENL